MDMWTPFTESVRIDFSALGKEKVDIFLTSKGDRLSSRASTYKSRNRERESIGRGKQ